MANPRLARLRRDREKLQELAARSQFICIQASEGNPAEKYVLSLTCRGITGLDRSGGPIYSESHQVGIQLHQDYPRKGPLVQMLTPVFHPNIAQNGLVCLGDEGDHGWAPGVGLDDLVVRVVEIIRYENQGLDSPFNLEAAAWARRNQHLFPLDSRQIVGEELPEIDILDDMPLDIQIIDQDSGGDEIEIVIL